MQKITSLPKKVLGFFQNHFFITLGVIAGIWFLSGDNPDIITPFPEGRHASDIAYESEELAAPVASSLKSVSSFGRSNIVADFIAPPTVQANDFVPEATEQKLVKNASLTLEVKDTEVSKTKVEEVIKEFRGQITNSNSWENRPDVLSYNMTIRIPVEQFDTALIALASLGRKTNESFNIRDITAQYQDNEARIANLESRRDRLRNMLERETESLSDVLQVDRELSSVQQQIENLERSQRRNDNDVSYSTLNLQIQPEPKIGDVSNPEWSVSRSWKQAVNDFLSSLHHIFDRAVKIIVFAPIWIPIVLVLWIVKRKFFR